MFVFLVDYLDYWRTYHIMTVEFIADYKITTRSTADSPSTYKNDAQLTILWLWLLGWHVIRNFCSYFEIEKKAVTKAKIIHSDWEPVVSAHHFRSSFLVWLMTYTTKLTNWEFQNAALILQAHYVCVLWTWTLLWWTIWLYVSKNKPQHAYLN